MIENQYKPDILSCIANLSSDEVFTPPKLVNDILDMLPQELFSDPKTTFLDPCCKSGVFLREIAKRLLVGLEPKIPDLQKRIDWIFHNQLFGLSITELTGLLSRRSVYCSRFANSKYSVTSFKKEQGHIRHVHAEHVWKNKKCALCGATQSEYERPEGLENHAYSFIHSNKVFNGMQFDVIIGNPPYQLSDGGAGASASPIFHRFVEQAKKLNPRYISMIIPAKWYSGGKGLDDFRQSMLADARLRTIHDFKSASDCFSGVEIKGGIMYFLWERDNAGETRVIEHIGNDIVSDKVRPLLEKGLDVFIRHNEAISILNKVFEKNPEIRKGKSFAEIVSSRKPFGFATNFTEFSDEKENGSVKIYANKKVGYISRNSVKIHQEWIDKWKVLTARANNIGTEAADDNLNTIVVCPETCCTETYLVVGGNLNLNEEKAKNIANYLQTKFLRFLVSLRKTTQDAVSKVYSFVPVQDFSKPWTDEELYAKYGLNDEEIAFIESMIRPME